MEIYGCLIAGLSLKDIQTIIEERDNKFSKNTQVRRVATKYSRETEYDTSSRSKSFIKREREKSYSFFFPVLPDDESFNSINSEDDK